MRRLLAAVLILPALLALPSLADSQKGKSAPIDAANLAPGQYSGVLKSIPGTDRTFVVEVQTQVVTPNVGALRGQLYNAARITRVQAQIAQARAQLGRARNPQQRRQALRRLQQLQLQLTRTVLGMKRATTGKVKTVKQLVEFQAINDVKVRSMAVPETEMFDEKGNIKRLTPAELLAIKGKDRNLPGYESSLDKLETGQKVTVTLAARPRNANADRDLNLLEREKRLQVKMIVVLP